MKGQKPMRYMTLALLAAVSVAMSSPAYAGCRAAADPDNPMMTDEDYGIARCRRDAQPSAEDPMVWPADQWLSDLMPGYSRSYDDRYDTRFSNEPAPVRVREVSIEKHVEIRGDDAHPPVRVRPKVLGVRSDANGGANVVRGGHRKCRGVLVLTWGPLGSKAHCHSGRGRARRIF
jgi:hypothetical protein